MPSPHLTPATLLLVAGLCASPLYSQALPSAPAIDPALAAQYFREAQQVCTHDAGELWGRSLCGPMMFVDDVTRSIAANQADKEGLLTEKEGVFVGKLPAQFSAANTAVVIAGVNWTMIEWPLPVTPAGRARLMAHELFHRIQAELGLPPSGPANAHLDSREGRIWLQLELRALRQALARTSAPASERYASVGDALVFRARRQSFFPNAAAEERALEMHEGLAEYTGMRLRGTSAAATAEYLAEQLDSFSDNPTFARSFAYRTGPAYGILLDMLGANWRKGLTPQSDFSKLISDAAGFRMPQNLATEADRRALDYDGEVLRLLETRREAEQQKKLASYRARLIDGPILIFPIGEKFDFSFDPNEVVVLDDAQTIYPTSRVTDSWGVLEVTDGVLIVREKGKFVRGVVQAPALTVPQGSSVQGNGWRLELAPGWQLAPGSRSHDFVVAKSK